MSLDRCVTHFAGCECQARLFGEVLAALKLVVGGTIDGLAKADSGTLNMTMSGAEWRSVAAAIAKAEGRPR